jgi:23S rRNA (cytidine1920-2'-O)/16S rRNA (cytidine1409-2'-O)-methyltransferase
MKQRLDKLMAQKGLAATRSEAESWIRLGRVKVNGKVVAKAGEFILEDAEISLDAPERYVSRAGLKLASVARVLGVDFANTTVLDVGSSTGGFTDYALQHGARKVFAVDVGTDQLHPSLRGDERIELHEKTDIRAFKPSEYVGIVVIDVSFISLRDILPHIASIVTPNTQIIAMVKPQFEADRRQIGSSGVVKNDTIRRQILKDFEAWSKRYFVIIDKADSEIAGANGNRERFYLLRSVISVL